VGTSIELSQPGLPRSSRRCDARSLPRLSIIRLGKVWDGAADPQTLLFVGVGIAVVIPIVLAYQAYAYWVFRGKTRLHGAYGVASE
jgi:cytochrome bd-type quinol oxidase subunit 2